MLSLSECIPWMTVGLAESVAIVTLNLCTIVVFVRNRNLRKRSTYLVINLAVIDMLNAGIVVYQLFYKPGVNCNLWKDHANALRTRNTHKSYLSGVGYAATRLRGYTVVKTFPPPWNMLVWKKVATRLRSCEDHPSPSKYVSKERSGYAATWLRSDCVAA